MNKPSKSLKKQTLWNYIIGNSKWFNYFKSNNKKKKVSVKHKSNCRNAIGRRKIFTRQNDVTAVNCVLIDGKKISKNVGDQKNSKNTPECNSNDVIVREKSLVESNLVDTDRKSNGVDCGRSNEGKGKKNELCFFHFVNFLTENKMQSKSDQKIDKVEKVPSGGKGDNKTDYDKPRCKPKKKHQKREIGVHLEIGWSRRQKGTKKEACKCPPPCVKIEPVPFIPPCDPTKRADKGLQVCCPCPPDGSSMMIKNIEKEMEFMTDKIESMDKIIDCYGKELQRRQKEIESRMRVPKTIDDKYTITRSTTHSSVICIRPPKNQEFKSCDNQKHRDCIRICPNKESFYIHGSCLTNEDEMIDVLDIFYSKLNDVLFKKKQAFAEQSKKCAKDCSCSECKKKDKKGVDDQQNAKKEPCVDPKKPDMPCRCCECPEDETGLENRSNMKESSGDSKTIAKDCICCKCKGKVKKEPATLKKRKSSDHSKQFKKEPCC